MEQRLDWIVHVKEHWKDYAMVKRDPLRGDSWIVNTRKIQGVLGCSHTTANKLGYILQEQILKDKPVAKRT